jgi:hypothetical protein
MAHPHKHQAKTGQERAKHRYADGGSIDNSLDISKPAPGQYPYGLEDAMSSAQSKNDSDEVASGKRFFDSGTRIPGYQKGLNDKWEKSRKDGS